MRRKFSAGRRRRKLAQAYRGSINTVGEAVLAAPGLSAFTTTLSSGYLNLGYYSWIPTKRGINSMSLTHDHSERRKPRGKKSPMDKFFFLSRCTILYS